MTFELNRRFVAVMIAVAMLALPAAASGPLAAGEVVPILSFPAADRPEGVALDTAGTIYVGLRSFSGGVRTSRILRIDGDGNATPFATLETAGNPATPGLLGLVVAPAGQVYAAVASMDLATHGVWCITPDGTSMTRLGSSESMLFPNALAFDSRGNLYATDSAAGAVWRFDDRGNGTPWLHDTRLEPGTAPIPGLPPVGANGIAFVPPDTLYVANTRQGTIVEIRIEPDGSAGAVRIAARGFALLSIDGIAADAHGDLHAAIPGFAVIPGSHPLLRVDPLTGDIVATPTDPAAFHFPVSLAFGTGARDHKSMFVVNSGPLLPVPGPGPGVVQAGVGVAGSIGR